MSTARTTARLQTLLDTACRRRPGPSGFSPPSGASPLMELRPILRSQPLQPTHAGRQFSGVASGVPLGCRRKRLPHELQPSRGPGPAARACGSVSEKVTRRGACTALAEANDLTLEEPILAGSSTSSSWAAVTPLRSYRRVRALLICRQVRTGQAGATTTSARSGGIAGDASVVR